MIIVYKICFQPYMLLTFLQCVLVVETECNNGASFLCDDTKCIPNSKLCDGMLDCENGQDELNCAIPKTCQEWWNAGYVTSGTYTVRE